MSSSSHDALPTQHGSAPTLLGPTATAAAVTDRVFYVLPFAASYSVHRGTMRIWADDDESRTSR